MEAYDLRWHVAHCATLRTVPSTLQFTAGQLFGGLAATQAGLDATAHYTATKWAVEDDEVCVVLRRVSSLIGLDDRMSSPRLAALEAAIAKAIEHLEIELPTRRDYQDATRVDQLWRLLQTVARMLDELRGDVEVALMASIKLTDPAIRRLTGAGPVGATDGSDSSKVR